MNEGEIPQYYVRDNHEAIIPPETFEMVQTLMATRKKGKNRLSSVSIFSSKIKCADCGSWYGPKVWHSNDAYRKVIRQCNHKFEGQKCGTPTLTEDRIKELFLRAANKVVDQKEQFIAIYEQVLMKSLDTTALESELSELEAEINIAAELIEDCINENAHVALDQTEYQKRYDALVARFDKVKAIIAQQLRAPEEKITLDARLVEDLGADSANVMVLIMEVEDQFGIMVEDDAIMTLKTVDDVVKYIDSRA